MAQGNDIGTSATCEIIDELTELREELIEAADSDDWELVQEIDDDINDVLEPFDHQEKPAELTQEIAVLRQTYQTIFAQCEEKRKALRAKMEALRSHQKAARGYTISQASTDQEVRASV